MEFELAPPADSEENEREPHGAKRDSSYQISSSPLVARVDAAPVEGDFLPLPRTYGTETLSLLARDPHTIFAFWDIDWAVAFREFRARERPVHLRLFDAEGIEQMVADVEPMAGSCYLTVGHSDTSYRGEIGFYRPPNTWKCLASSALITTPPNDFASDGEVDFATVPSHLSFQRMVDLLQVSQRENESLTGMLADLRERADSAEAVSLTPEQRELAHIVETVRSTTDTSAPARSSDPRLHRKLERILGFGGTSPTSGFGGSSRGA